MQKRKISFGQEGLFNTSSPHPKREDPHYHKNKRQPFKDKQSAEQFMQSFFNLNSLMLNTFSQKKQNIAQTGQEFPLANHLSGYYAAKKSVQSRANYRNNAGNHKYHFVQNTTKTQQTFIDEESEFQNYLKQYSTVIKNSRSKEFISPMAHKKEMDELITQFLSDMQESDVKSSDLSPNNNKMLANNKGDKQQKQNNTRSPTSQAIKIQKIDLTGVKANSYQSSHNKSNKKDTIKQQREISKRKQTGKSNKQRPIIIKVQKNSPNFSEDKRQVSTQQKFHAIKKTNTKQKSNDKLKIQVINVQDLRTKNSIPEQKQKKSVHYSEKLMNLSQNIQKGAAQSNSYLQQNYYKISKNQQRKQNNQRYKVYHQQSQIKKAPEPIGKKPLKIQIQISDEFDDQQPKIELDSSLQKQKTQIIRMVSKKVSNMIQDTQKIALNKVK